MPRFRSRLPIFAALALGLTAWPLMAQDSKEAAAEPRFQEIKNRGPGAFLDRVENKLYLIDRDLTFGVIDLVAGTLRSRLFKRVDKVSFKRPTLFVSVQPILRRGPTVDLFDQSNGILCCVDPRNKKLTRIDLLNGVYDERALELKVAPEDREALERLKQKGNVANAIGAMRTLSTAQSIFRESDRDQDGMFDYGNLMDLGKTNLIDNKLASGTKQGYVFECEPSTKNPEYIWWATAHPKDPKSGGPCFFTNHSGVIYTSDEPIEVNKETCEPTRKLKALGAK